MKIRVVTEILVRQPAQVVWDYFTDSAQLLDFTGYGPIPGIEHTVVHPGVPTKGQGLIRDVHNTDGSTHIEQVITFDPPTRFVDRLYGFQAPLRWLIEVATDDFSFEVTTENVTRVRRIFAAELTTPLLWPVALFLKVLMRQAITRHHSRVRAKLEALS